MHALMRSFSHFLGAGGGGGTGSQLTQGPGAGGGGTSTRRPVELTNGRAGLGLDRTGAWQLIII